MEEWIVIVMHCNGDAYVDQCWQKCAEPGAQIIDMMMLVIDVTKGMQTQTAECLVIGEITCDRMLVVLNKIDLLAAEKRQTAIERVSPAQ